MVYLTYNKIMQMVKKLNYSHKVIKFIILTHNNPLFINLINYHNLHITIMI